MIATVLYVPILHISVKKGVLTGMFEQLLGMLLFALLYGALLVILAVIQIVNKPAENKSALHSVSAPAVAKLS